jgi:hypothetical protein
MRRRQRPLRCYIGSIDAEFERGAMVLALGIGGGAVSAAAKKASALNPAIAAADGLRNVAGVIVACLRSSSGCWRCMRSLRQQRRDGRSSSFVGIKSRAVDLSKQKRPRRTVLDY